MHGHKIYHIYGMFKIDLRESRGQYRAVTLGLGCCYKLSVRVLANNVSYIDLRYLVRYQ